MNKDTKQLSKLTNKLCLLLFNDIKSLYEPNLYQKSYKKKKAQHAFTIIQNIVNQ